MYTFYVRFVRQNTRPFLHFYLFGTNSFKYKLKKNESPANGPHFNLIELIFADFKIHVDKKCAKIYNK